MKNELRSSMKDLLLLSIRLTLSYGFLNAAIMKFQDVSSNAEWFKSIGIPFPVINTWLSGGVEAIGAVFLIAGLLVRLTSVSLIFLMIIAILTVHIGTGFNSANNGFEINLYYILMLLTLLLYGYGKYSVNRLISHEK